ncbi:MAG: hypothetical protein CW346_02015 [Bacillaceae bacterium]|nr:hypothetical protein [Bacillaceae bacterium]OUM85891.1 MAG: hypothetical protein BAA03_15345 [Caldibacillus debilis]
MRRPVSHGEERGSAGEDFPFFEGMNVPFPAEYRLRFRSDAGCVGKEALRRKNIPAVNGLLGKLFV